MQAEFDGHPVSEHNLSQWRNGGYQDWLRYQEAVALAEHLYEQAEETKARGKERIPMSEVLHLWLNSRYVVSTQEIETLEGEAAWKKQRQMCEDLMKMRRAEHREAQLQLERERVELHRQETQLERERFEAEKEFKARAEKRQEKSPRRRSGSGDGDHYESEENNRPLTEDEREQRWKAALGIPYVPRSK